MAKRRLISETERIALEAGTVGFEASLLNGNPDWKALAAIPDGKLTEEEQAFLDGPCEEFCRMIDDWEISQSSEQDMPQEAWDFIKKEGFLGLVIDKKYGGKGFSALAHSAVVMKLASRSFAAAINVMVPNSLGPGELIAHYGTQAQKDKYLPRLAAGQEIPCFGLTEPEAGSDATSLSTRGVVKRDEKGEPYIHIDNLEKRYITLAPVATLLGIAFTLEDPENILGKGETPGITLALVPRNTDGLEVGNRLRPMDVPFNNGTIRGDIKIPVSAVIGEENGVGQGWRMLMEALSIGRSISLPSVSVSAAKTMAYVAGAYARVRQQFGLPVGRFEGLEEPMARIAGLAYLSDAVRITTARMVDAKLLPTVPSAIAKYHLTENMRQTVNDAMDILAGKAVISGPGNPVNKVYQGIPIGITVEGANIMTRNMMIFGQGGMRSHKHMIKLLNKLEKGKYLHVALRGALMFAETIGAAIHTSLPSLLHPAGAGPVDPRNRHYYRHINRLSVAFKLASNASYLSQQTELKRKERMSARLGDVFSHLYMASAALQKFENDGRPEDDRVLLDWSVRHCFDKAEDAFDQFLKNYPGRIQAFTMRASIFPFYQIGTRSWKPKDALEHKVAQTILNPGETREKLTDGIFKPVDTVNDTIAAFNDAFMKCAQADALERAARKEGKTLSAEEQAIVDAAEKARAKVVYVDEYGPDARTPYKMALEN
ncbi:MAG: acyl-CoA dehydrogenase [Alphaproteobacteria bacterium]|nr:acyl-CoA dehydrogenase [Alphaproteobacteria bacterium]